MTHVCCAWEIEMGRRRADKEPDVHWQVTDQVLGGLTLRRVINLHHFLALSSDGEVLGLRLEAYQPPTEKDPWSCERAVLKLVGFTPYLYKHLGFAYEVWWGYEWRKRTRPPRWVRELAWSTEYGKRKRFTDDGVEIKEPAALPPNDEEQLTLF